MVTKEQWWIIYEASNASTSSNVTMVLRDKNGQKGGILHQQRGKIENIYIDFTELKSLKNTQQHPIGYELNTKSPLNKLQHV